MASSKIYLTSAPHVTLGRVSPGQVNDMLRAKDYSGRTLLMEAARSGMEDLWGIVLAYIRSKLPAEKARKLIIQCSVAKIRLTSTMCSSGVRRSKRYVSYFTLCHVVVNPRIVYDLQREGYNSCGLSQYLRQTYI